ncbi:MAG: AbrB/MazE/SpoVT family DNA-binding domain-containing protein [Bacillus sp. (in: Bacteria)]|nr:AbrB/MazE/SpoVT family DNA-binding domain-containing protein [Bacillus sp. (in: firmicutes)]
MNLLSGKMTKKGQITIPKEIRDKFDLNEGDQFKIFVQDDEVKLKPFKKKKLSQAIGKIISNEAIDIKKMRQYVHEEAAKDILSEENKNE